MRESNVIVVVVNLDPRTTQWGFVTLPLELLGIAADRPYDVEDLLTGAMYEWNGARNYVSLNPQDLPKVISCGLCGMRMRRIELWVW